MSHPDPRQAPHLLVEALRQFSCLMQKELQLARAEMSNILGRAGAGLALLVAAALLVMTALHVIAGALVAYLAATGLSAGTSAAIVAAGCIGFALALVLIARSRLSAEALKPTQTIRNIQCDAATVKGATDA